MPPASGKHTVTRMEQWVGFGVLVVLAAIALGIYTVQFRFNPAVTAREVLSASATPTASFSLADLAPAAIEPFSPPEHFDPETLSDKINGKAERTVASRLAPDPPGRTTPWRLPISTAPAGRSPPD